ncbi:MAG TPA: endonuclease III [Candidatus Binataceae bacterium]|nr:endonuclease III [Candidatus Binataceae bacterium]
MNRRLSKAPDRRRRAAPAATVARRIGAILRVLRREAPGWNAPIVSFISIQTRDPFKTLISCILSLRTKDQTTAAASERLFARAATPEAILAIPLPTLERLIFPVGFYRTKATVIRGICRDLIDKHGGRVPDEIDTLLTLKGVGRKTANLVVTEAYRKPGICVDTHVHRISNRWGLVATRTPDKTETALREILPRRYWLEYNGILVAFGQTICHPTSPRCTQCPIERACPRIGVIHSR